MDTTLERYSKIREIFPREMILIQGTGCRLSKKCAFCDYYLDVSENPYTVNSPIIDMVTGEFGILDVINSGSVLEIDKKTLFKIKDIVKKNNIHTLWFESHWMYRNKLIDIKNFFTGIDVKFRMGVETFNEEIREKWGKRIPRDTTPSEMSKYFQGICLLFGIKGQTLDDIINDIKIASEYFEYFSVNIYNENTKKEVEIDKPLIQRFVNEVYPEIENIICKDSKSKIEVLINNTDLGVG